MVYKDLPVHNVGELIALMKSSKETVIKSPRLAPATVNFLASILFAAQAGVKVEQIIEKGSGPLVTDMMGGFVKVGFNPIPASRAGLDGGYIRALAVTSAKHSTLMPNLPTLAESGLPGFDATLSYGLLAPAGTPQPIVQKLNKALNEALADDAVRKRIVNEGAEPEPGTSAEQAAVIDREETTGVVVIEAAGIQPK